MMLRITPRYKTQQLSFAVKNISMSFLLRRFSKTKKPLKFSPEIQWESIPERVLNFIVNLAGNRASVSLPDPMVVIYAKLNFLCTQSDWESLWRYNGHFQTTCRHFLTDVSEAANLAVQQVRITETLVVE